MTLPARLFGEGFRVFFLAAGIFGLIAVLWWGLWLADLVALPPSAAAPSTLHGHEMIFGYAAAAMGGFFLTAVPNWTGAQAAKHLFIASVAGIWCAGRIATALSGHLPPGLVAVIDLGFLPVLGAKLLTQLLKRPKPQNLMFLALIALMEAGEALMQADWLGLGWGDAGRGLRLGLYAACAMIAVLGGRVTPAFTRNAMLRVGQENDLPVSRRPVEVAGIAGAIGVALAALLALPGPVMGAMALFAGGAQLARLIGWRSRWTLHQPILWALHLGWALLGLGYLLTGLAAFGIGDGFGALHVLGIGAVGGMTLAVMSRASLGHTGRALVAPGPVVLAYALIPAATLARYGANAWPAAHAPLTLTAATLWCAAMALFLAALGPALLGPRAVTRPPVGPAPPFRPRPNVAE